MITTKKVSHMALMLAIAGLLYVNFLLPNDALSVCLTLFCCVYLLTCQAKYVIPMTIFLSFFAKLFCIGNYPIWIFIIGCMFIRVLLVKERGFWSLFLETIVYVFLHIISVVINRNLTSSGGYIPIFFGLFLSGACFYYRAEDKSQCLQHYMWGFFVSSIMGMFAGGTRLEAILEYDHFVTTTGDSVSRFCGLAFDSNFYGVLAVVALFLVLFESEVLFHNKKKTLWYLSLGAALIFGMLSYSKTYFLIMLLLMIVAFVKASKDIKRRLLKMIPVACIALLVFHDTLGNAVQNIIDRFTSAQDIGELTTGRSDLWILYIKKIFSDFSLLIFGAGIQGLGLAAAHNLYLEILSRFGLAGMIGNLFHLRFSARMLDVPKSKKSKTRRMILGMLLFIMFFALSAYKFESLWIVIFIAIISGQETSVDRLESYEQVAAEYTGV